LKNNKKIKIHVKNNHWASGSFPTDAEGEKVFTIKNSHFEKAFEKFPEISGFTIVCQVFLKAIFLHMSPLILLSQTN